MGCTLHPDVIPPVHGSTGVSNNDQHMVVWDNEKDAWRMINIDCEVL